MIRIKLFLFYTAMAWVSLVAPRHGRVLVDDAAIGSVLNRRKWEKT